MSDSIRDALTAAYEAAETDQPETAVDTTNSEPVDTSPVDTSDTVSEPTDSAGAESATETGSSTPAPAAAPAPSVAPPASWNAAEKALWANVPQAAQEAIRRREAEHDRFLKQTAEQRKTADEYNKAFQPYDELLEQYGATRMDVIQPLLAMRAAFETGTVAQKAGLVANIIQQFGVDLQSLDAILTQRVQAGGGQLPAWQPPAPAQQDIGSIIEQALAKHPLIQQYQNLQVEQAKTAVSAVENLPHFAEVRLEMADILERAKNRGKEITLETAYDIACRTYGLEVASPAPTAGRDEKGRFQSLEASRKAASSISGSPKPTAGYKPGSGSVRDDLEHAFNSR